MVIHVKKRRLVDVEKFKVTVLKIILVTQFSSLIVTSKIYNKSESQIERNIISLISDYKY